MKLRCTTNSIRLRLRKSDLNRLAEAGRLMESVHFGGEVAFCFELAISDEVVSPVAQMEPFVLRLTLPGAQARQWIESNEVGIEHDHPLGSDGSLHMLIEKDFPCKDRPDEDKADTFRELAAQAGKDDAC